MFLFIHRVKALLYMISKDIGKSLAESDLLELRVPWDRVIFACVELMVDLCGSRLRAGIPLDQEGHWLTGEFKHPLEWHTAVANTMTAQAQAMESRMHAQFNTAPGEQRRESKRRRNDSALGPSPVRVRLSRSLNGLAEEKEANFKLRTDPVVHDTAQKKNNVGEKVLDAFLSEASLSKRCRHKCDI